MQKGTQKSQKSIKNHPLGVPWLIFGRRGQILERVKNHRIFKRRRGDQKMRKVTNEKRERGHRHDEFFATLRSWLQSALERPLRAGAFDYFIMERQGHDFTRQLLKAYRILKKNKEN